MKLLSNKVAIVTGASSGIGRASAKLFASEGAKVVVSGRRAAALEALLQEITDAGGEAHAVVGDVGDEAHAAALVAAARTHFGGLDVALNNAGTLGTLLPFSELTKHAWDHTLRVNLESAFFAAKHQLPALLERGAGSLMFTSSFVGHTVGMPTMAAYAASKQALVGLTKVLAAEYGAHGIRVNALLPGGTDTPLAREFASTPEALQVVAGLHALKRIASPEEIARSALYLASELGSFTTGSALLVDGGVSITRV